MLKGFQAYLIILLNLFRKAIKIKSVEYLDSSFFILHSSLFILHSSFENTLTDFYNPFLQVVKFFPGDMGRFFLEAELMGDGTVN